MSSTIKFASCALRGMSDPESEACADWALNPTVIYKFQWSDFSNSRIAEILSATLGRQIKYVNLPPKQMKQALFGAGVPEWNTNGILDLETLYRDGAASTVTGDVELVLGRQPITYEQFARDYASSLSGL